ncbi:MAG TPA: endospore germination permease [Bacillales bacterium]|nr:endospore germination permease [Bacillales bacterium]
MKKPVLETGRISISQTMLLLFILVNATAVLSAPSIMGKNAGRALWLSPMWAAITGFAVLVLAIGLHHFFPKKTIIEYGNRLLGPFFGKLAGAAFLLYLLHQDGIIMREYMEFVVGVFLEKTPVFIILGGMALLTSFAARGGIEVLGRLGQLLVPSTLLIWTLLLLLTFQDWTMTNILPLTVDDVVHSIRGSIAPQTWYTEFFLVAFLLPYTKHRKGSGRWGTVVIIATVVTLSVVNLICVFVFGNLVPTLTYPVMTLIRYINIADFFEHIDALLLIIWVVGVFLKLAFFQYCIMLGTAQWFNMSDYRPLALPIGFLTVLLGIWVAPNLQELTRFISSTDYFYMISFFVVYPLLLLVIAFIRKRFNQGVS